MRSAVLRNAIALLVALGLLVGLLLLAQQFILFFAPPRDDTVYAVAAESDVAKAPIMRDLLLNKPHGLLGERPSGSHAAITVVISRTVTGQYAVVNAWSPVSDCLVTLGADRVTDCAGHQWTLAGDPFDEADPPLQRFPVTIQTGALIVDFTHPVGGGG